MHRRLKRQLRQCFPALQDESNTIDGIRESQPISYSNEQLLEFIDKINSSYEQHERDLTLRTESLRISSSELMELNEKLNRESQTQGDLIEAIRNSTNRLLDGLGEEKIQPGLMNAQRITEVLTEVFEELESAHVDLQYQKEALDHHAIVILCDAEGVIEYVNSNFRDISGYGKDELIGKNKLDLSLDEEQRQNMDRIMKRVAQGEVWHGELPEHDKHGQGYWVASTIVPLFDRNNNVKKIITIQTDLTPRKKAEQALEQERHFLYSVTDTMAEAVFTVDAEGLCTYFNKEAEHLAGYHRDEVIGKDLLALLNARDEDGMLLTDKRHSLWEKYENNSRFRSETLVFSTKTGKEFDVSLGIMPVRGNEIDYGMVGVFHNITGRRKSERKLEKAKDAAERTTRLKSDFIANMSHEIRTPLNAIIGLSQIALTNEKDLVQHQQIKKIHHSGKALLHIINDILDFSKIEAGQLTVEHIDFNVQELIENLTTITTVSAEKKNIELFITKESHLPNNLIGDPLRISQILLNLISNAIKFTSQGRVTVHFSATNRHQDKIELMVSVSDTGIGITEEQLKRMFLPYSQADTSTTRRFGGSGLGLSISQKLAKLMGGEISVKSTAGEGSTFTLRLPIERNRLLEIDPTNLSLKDKKAIFLCETEDEIPLDSLRLFGLSVSRFPLNEALNQTSTEFARVDVIFINPPKNVTNHQSLLDEVDKIVGSIPKIIFSEPLAQQTNNNGLLDKERADYAIAPPLNSSKLWDVIASIPNFESSFVKPDSPKEARLGSLDGYTILVAEDNEINQEVAYAILSSFGASVVIANNGVEAIEQIEQNPNIDIVLMDVQMPIMDGFTATEEIRKIPKFDSIPILALTAHVMKDVLERGEAVGMTDHVNKPIDPDDLYMRLVRYLPDKPRKLSQEPKPIDESITQDDLPGFDVEGSLNRLGQNVGLYKKLLRQFVKEFTSSGEKIKKSLSASDIQAAKYEVHHLKGVSGSIGATELFKKCRRFENSAHNPDSLDAEAEQLCHILDESILTINSFSLATNEPDADSTETTNKPIDESHVGALAKDSLLLLAQGNAKVLDLLQDWCCALKGTEHQKMYFQLSEQINNFDFSEAKNTVHQIVEQIGAGQNE